MHGMKLGDAVKENAKGIKAISIKAHIPKQGIGQAVKLNANGLKATIQSAKIKTRATENGEGI